MKVIILSVAIVFTAISFVDAQGNCVANGDYVKNFVNPVFSAVN